MAAPNIVNVSTIFGKTQYQQLTTTMANVITNDSTSGNVIKVNDISIANYTTSSIQSNVVVGRGSSVFYLAGNMAVPANSTLVVVAKDTSLYMEEGDYLQEATLVLLEEKPRQTLPA
jgi:uncharacterized membrane protein YcgQ (UPF0703/DUF1980 family)